MTTIVEPVAESTETAQAEALARKFAEQIRRLADGDLTVELEVGSGPMGDLARVFNFSVRALQERMSALEDASAQIVAGARRTRELATELSEATPVQRRTVADAREFSHSLRQDIARVDSTAELTAKAAVESIEAVEEGRQAAEAVVDEIGESAGATNAARKLLKRLAESTQELGDVSRLVDELSSQAQILAINAAITAERDQETRARATVLSDGLEKLRESSQEAARDIEALVRRIGQDTGDAVAQIEQATSSTASTSDKAGRLGEALAALEQRAQALGASIEEGRERRVAAGAETLSESLDRIAEGASVGGENASAVTESAMHLAQFADVLQATIATFRTKGR